MLSTILITFIYCRPNKWNNQEPLIQAASGAWGCMAVLKGSRGKRLESPLESRAVINEWRTATNYMHSPKKADMHTHSLHVHTINLFLSPLFFSVSLILSSVLSLFHITPKGQSVEKE